MARKRDYKAEYRRRIERGLKRGLSRSQARGHPKSTEKPVSQQRTGNDAKIEAAIRSINQGRSLTAAARSAHVSTDRLKRYLNAHDIGDRKGRRWVVDDRRPRRIPVLTKGRQRTLFVDGYAEARLAGEHFETVGRFVRTNDLDLLRPYEGLSIRGANGQDHPLETDPNELHRIAAMGDPDFHEIYQITSND